jgi:hypothetical protein
MCRPVRVNSRPHLAFWREVLCCRPERRSAFLKGWGCVQVLAVRCVPRTPCACLGVAVALRVDPACGEPRSPPGLGGDAVPPSGQRAQHVRGWQIDRRLLAIRAHPQQHTIIAQNARDLGWKQKHVDQRHKGSRARTQGERSRIRLDLKTPERSESEHLSRDIQRDDLTKRLLQVGGCVAGSRTNLHAPSPREWPTSGQRVRQRLVTLRCVSVAPTSSKLVEERGHLRRSFRRPRVTVHGNRPRQLSHRTRNIPPIRPPGLIRNDPRQLDHAHPHRARLPVLVAAAHAEVPFRFAGSCL